ncbi:hypothetical protein LMG28138_03012 [Pararobbsia alpina]|uniref:Uncharacterized protein n=2 Tax=Pararobbsia alpina TaxID=621374 RepID=A0A6S7BGK6_9BURK|nr:hypothetical protein LMG28138_03012 [Pararobbsia alpina]
MAAILVAEHYRRAQHRNQQFRWLDTHPVRDWLKRSSFPLIRWLPGLDGGKERDAEDSMWYAWLEEQRGLMQSISDWSMRGWDAWTSPAKPCMPVAAVGYDWLRGHIRL